MGLMITVERLTELLACESGIEHFLNAFPDGKVYSDTLIEILQEKKSKKERLRVNLQDSLGWLAARYTGMHPSERLAILKCIELKNFWAGEIVDDGPEMNFEELMQFVELTNYPAKTAKRVLQHGYCGGNGTEPLTDEQKEYLRKYILDRTND